MVSFDKENLREQINWLKSLPQLKEVKSLIQRLEKELGKLSKSPKLEPIQKSTVSANQKRSGRLKRYHNYIRQIRNNFPKYSYSEIRKQFAKRRRQEDVSIPDAVWQNPSP